MKLLRPLLKFFKRNKSTTSSKTTQVTPPEYRKYTDQVVIPPSTKESAKPPTNKTEPIIIDLQSSKIVQHTDNQPDRVALEKAKASLPPNTPEDIVHLTLINKAFREGIEAIKRLNLDEDLFQQAITDLYKKYRTERSKYLDKI